MQTILVMEDPSLWRLQIDGVRIVDARTYLTDDSFSFIPAAKVLNLCRSYRYQSLGYYISLIAEARGHFPLPSVTTIQDMKLDVLIQRASRELDSRIQKSLKNIRSETFELSIYFGKNIANVHSRLSSILYNIFPLPFFRAYFIKVKGHWKLDNIRLIATKHIPESHHYFVVKQINEYFGRKVRKVRGKVQPYQYEMAILRSKEDKTPPSNQEAIEKFCDAADKLGIRTDIITSNDYAWLDRYDALFIRDTTAVNHYTYRFARRAEAVGLVAIDDPLSILRCTNKIYLDEILYQNKIPMPPSIVFGQHNQHEVETEIGFPCVVKLPDSSFSMGVYKYDTKEEFMAAMPELFKRSVLLLAQAFVPTKFDWRIGVLNNQPLFVCRYHMADKHWQIYNYDNEGGPDYGESDTIKVSEAPKNVINCALKAAALIGDGLYGVDLKVINGKACIIEVNDNPSIDVGCEDLVLKDKLYEIIIKDFKRRMDALHGK